MKWAYGTMDVREERQAGDLWGVSMPKCQPPLTQHERMLFVSFVRALFGHDHLTPGMNDVREPVKTGVASFLTLHALLCSSSRYGAVAVLVAPLS